MACPRGTCDRQRNSGKLNIHFWAQRERIGIKSCHCRSAWRSPRMTALLGARRGSAGVPGPKAHPASGAHSPTWGSCSKSGSRLGVGTSGEKGKAGACSPERTNSGRHLPPQVTLRLTWEASTGRFPPRKQCLWGGDDDVSPGTPQGPQLRGAPAHLPFPPRWSGGGFTASPAAALSSKRSRGQGPLDEAQFPLSSHPGTPPAHPSSGFCAEERPGPGTSERPRQGGREPQLSGCRPECLQGT